MSTRPLKPPVVHSPPSPPPIPRRMKLKLRRMYLDLTSPRMEREWVRAWPLIDSVPGYLQVGQERWLFEAAYSLPDRASIVEIGSFMGRSTCSLASGCRGTQKRVFAIDTFNGNDSDFPARGYLEQFSENVKGCGLSGYVEPVVGASHEIARSWNRPIHMLFIDGSHQYEDVLADFEAFFPHIVPGGLVAFHDVCDNWPGVLRLWEETAKRQLVDTGHCKSLAYGRKPASRSEYYNGEFFERLRERATLSAEVIVPLVLELVPARSVVDIGCGEGAWLMAFRRSGVEDVLGIDGDYVDEARLLIPRTCFRAADLSRPFTVGRTFDLAVSLEVAEHLPPESAPAFVEGLARLAPVILFSAAIPRQGGIHHVNEQWPEYWAALFESQNFVPIDAIRKRVWGNERIDWWYAQNTLIFAERDFVGRNNGLNAEFRATRPSQLALVHPRQYEFLCGEYDQALSRESYLREHPASGVKQAITILRNCARNSVRVRLERLWNNQTVRAAKAK